MEIFYTQMKTIFFMTTNIKLYNLSTQLKKLENSVFDMILL